MKQVQSGAWALPINPFHRVKPNIIDWPARRIGRWNGGGGGGVHGATACPTQDEAGIRSPDHDTHTSRVLGVLVLSKLHSNVCHLGSLIDMAARFKFRTFTSE